MASFPRPRRRRSQPFRPHREEAEDAPREDGGGEPVWSLKPGSVLLYLLAGAGYIALGALVPEALLSLLYGYGVALVCVWAAPALARRARRKARR